MREPPVLKVVLVLAAGYTGYKLAYESEDARHYGKLGAHTLRTALALLFAGLTGGAAAALMLP